MPRKPKSEILSRPMLAVAVKDVESLKYPVLATPKLDGIRCLVVNGRAMTRKFKPVPNHYIREKIEAICPDGFDGEIMIPGSDFNKVQSLVMSEDGTPNFEYHVFDFVRSCYLGEAYEARMETLRLFYIQTEIPFIRYVLPVSINSVDKLLSYEQVCLQRGYEGVMIRDPEGPYKCGRSTLKEGWLLKLKRFEDSEAEIIGFEEQMHNANAQKENELGLMKRSTAKDGLVPAGTLGALLVRDCKSGVEFSIGTGMDDAMRAEIWSCRGKYICQLVTYKFQPTGVKEKPRFPVFKGFRNPNDISE